MDLVYKRKIERLQNNKINNKTILWDDITKKLNISNKIEKNLINIYEKYNKNFIYKIDNITDPIKNINVKIYGILDNGILLYLKNNDLNNDDQIKIQLQLYCTNLNECNFYNTSNNKINKIYRNNKQIKDILNKIFINKKRKVSFDDDNIAKKTKREWNNWVPASKVRNYLMKDPLLDWLNLQNNRGNSNVCNNIKYDKFTSYIMNKGIEFENVIIKIIKNKFKNDFIQIGEPFNGRDINKYYDTIESMKKGIPIIYQGVLHNEENCTYGVPDLIVRSDYINKLIKMNIINNNEINIPAPNLNLNYHYRIIDIKCCSLNLTADGNHLLNTGSVSAYKGQLYIYNLALSKIMGYNAQCSYILGKKWSYTCCGNKFSGNNSFDRLGIINYKEFDSKYIDLTNEAIEWINKLQVDGKDWKIYDENNDNKPTVNELYPNMSNTYDSPWHNYKNKISRELNEITLLWQCGVVNREIAHSNNIYSWKDKKCNAKLLGISGKKNAPILDKILEINRGNDLITTKIKNNDGDWQNKNKLEFFVDFETINDVCSDFNVDTNKVISNGVNMIFMIGVGYELNKKWNFTTFLAKDNTIEEEKIMLDNFYKFITKTKNEILGENKPFPNMYHWGHIERTLFETAKRRHCNNTWNNLKWFDMLNVFKKEPIVIKDCLNFGLKDVAKAMYKHGFIKTTWKNSIFSSGTNAMIYAYNEYKKYKNLNENIKYSHIMQNIAEYNHIDCKVIYEIINYLRKN